MSLSPVVVIILVVVAGLILLYLVGRLVKPLGHAIAFACTVIARFLVKSQEYLIKAAAYSNRVCKASLKSINETGEWTMHDLTQRLNDFSVGLFILVGESILAMEVLPSLFPAAAQVSLPPVFEYSSAALFILCSAMFGDILFTCWGKTRGVGLFHNMGKPSRWIVGSLALLLLVFSDLVNGYFYIFRAAILAHKNTQDMTMYILGGLGLEVSAVAPFALHAVKQNSSSVVAVLWWFAEKTFEILAAFASFVPHVLDVIAIHLGGTSVYQKFDTPDSVKVPGLQFVPGGHNETATGLPPSQIVSPPPSPVVVGVGGSSIVPCETHELEVLAMSERLVCLTLNGVLGSRLLPYVRASLAPVKPLIRSSGRVDTFSPIVAPVGLGVDVSPSALQRAHASSVKEQFDSMGNNIVEAHSPVRDIPALHVHVLDCHTGLDAFQMLRDTKRRLPGITQVVVTAVTSADLANHSVQILLNELARLPREGVIATTLLVSLSSPLVRSLGEEKFFSYVGRLLADLCACHTHSLNNLSAVALFDQLGKASPFLSLAVATAETVSGNTPLRGFG